eukprot:scaffold13983_cov125-Isochrysis_galbana.AAC.14
MGRDRHRGDVPRPADASARAAKHVHLGTRADRHEGGQGTTLPHLRPTHLVEQPPQGEGTLARSVEQIGRVPVEQYEADAHTM